MGWSIDAEGMEEMVRLPPTVIGESAQELVGELFQGRYVLKEELGSTSRTRLWRAGDRTGGPDVAIKVFAGDGGGPRFESYLAFKRQAKVLARISHPRVARLLAIERTPGAVAVVEELFPGLPLSRRPHLPLPPRVVAAILYQVVEALEPFHEIGFWHRRLTPSNILLAGSDAGRLVRESWEVDVRIIHLGHSLLADAGPRGDEPAEEHAYTAPESAGMLPRAPDGRADFWSLGVTAYELLGGRLPWEGATAAAYLHRVMALNPRPLAALVPGVPEALAGLVNRLIAKSPDDRPPSTAALREELRSIGRMEGGTDDTFVPAARGGLPLKAPELIEREVPLRRLRARFDLACAGEGGAVIVSGESGVGKTRLVEELRPHVEASGGVFLSTRANEFEKNLPLHAIRQVIDSYVEAVRRAPQERRVEIIARIQAALGSLGGGLLQVVPSVRELLVNVPDMVPLDPERERQRFVSTVISFLLGISFAGQPILLFFDDLHWVDAESRDIFEKLAARVARAHLLLVGALRSGAEGAAGDGDRPRAQPVTRSEPAGPLRRTGVAPRETAIERMEVNPLTFEGTTRLLRTVLGLTGERLEGLPEFAFERARGNVRFTLEIAGVLREASESERTGRAGLERLKAIVPAAGPRSTFRKIDRLPPADREVLELAALIGRGFSLPLLLSAAGKDPGEVRRAIQVGIDHGVIAPSSREPEGLFQFIDGSLQEDLYGRIDPARRQRAHERIGDLLLEEGGGPERVFEVAYHHQRCGDPRKSVRASLRAGDEAKRTHASLQAARFYEKALQEAGECGVEIDRARLLEDLGDAYALKGRYPDAERAYRTALEPGGDRPREARLHGKIGDMHFRRGASAEAIPHLRRGLAALGIRLPESRWGIFLSIALRVALLALRGAIPRRRPSSLPEADRPAAREAVKILHSLSWACFFLDGPRAIEAHLRQLLLAERLGPSRELAQAWCDHGMASSIVPWRARARRYLVAGLALRRSIPDPWGVGQSWCFLGISSYSRGDFARALEELREGIRILERVGDLWEVESAYIHVSLIHQVAGDFPAALSALDTVLALGEGLEDRKFQALALIGRSRVLCHQGELDLALDSVERALALDADPLARAVALRVKAQVLLRHGLPEEALAALSEAAGIIRRNRLRGEYVAENPVVIAEALAAGAEGLLALSRRERRRRLARLGAAVRAALRSARAFPICLGPALRARAVHRWLRGDLTRALADFARSRAVLARLGARYELGRTRLEAGRWLARSGDPRGSASLDEAIRIFQEIGARRDLEEARELRLRGGAGASDEGARRGLRGENRRLASLFKASQSIASILELDRLLRRGVDLAIEVLGAERGFILLAGEGGEDPAVSVARDVNGRDLAPAEYELNPEVLRKVHAEQRPRVVTEEISSLRPGPARHLRSILCVPLRSKGRPMGLLYVDNRLVKDLYREPDVELLSTFSAQLAVAIENARAYREIEELNLGLEEKVRERTAELLQAKGVLEKANLMKDEFLANMSHELRTPLNAVIALSDILSEETFGPLNEKQRKYVGDIIQSGTHLLSLINDILDLSKVEAGQMRLQTSTFDLNRLLGESLVMVKEKAARHRIALSLSLDPRLAPVEADHRKVKQVVYNLLSNAVKFTADGGRVVVRSGMGGGGEAVVSIEDTGIGIAREDLGKMFQEFQQIDSSLSRKYPGTGLGLALSRKFVELHGGRIWVESEPGKGSSFSFAIPTARGAAEGAARAAGEPNGPQGTTLDR